MPNNDIYVVESKDNEKNIIQRLYNTTKYTVIVIIVIPVYCQIWPKYGRIHEIVSNFMKICRLKMKNWETILLNGVNWNNKLLFCLSNNQILLAHIQMINIFVRNWDFWHTEKWPFWGFSSKIILLFGIYDNGTYSPSELTLFCDQLWYLLWGKKDKIIIHWKYYYTQSI